MQRFIVALVLSVPTLALAAPASSAKSSKSSKPASALAPATVAKSEAKRWSLPNGLDVLFLAEHKAPIVTVQVFYKVGGKDEPPTKRGIAHMFEHLMFKGSEHVRPEDHAQFVDSVGGENNAFTTDDVTGYHDTVPPNAFEFTLQLEAERMRKLLLTQDTIDSEREVVKEELRMRVENSPMGQARKKLLELAFTQHPYRISAIGQKAMLDTVTLEDCQQFYDRYYQPNNAILVIVGDVDELVARALVDKYFAPLVRGPEIVRAAIVEPPQTELREVKLELPVQRPLMFGAFHIVGGDSNDLYAFEVLQQILSDGQSSRLPQRLVHDDKVALAAGGFVLDMADPGLFALFSSFLATADPTKIRSALLEEIARVSNEPVTAAELTRAKNQLAAQAAFRRERVAQLATAMGTDAVIGKDPLRLWKAPAHYDAVTAADIQRVAKQYLVPSNLTLVTLVPVAGGAK